MDVETRFVRGYNAKDINALKSVLHSGAGELGFMTNPRTLESRFHGPESTNRTFTMDLRTFRFIGMDGDAAFVRVGLRAEGTVSPGGISERLDVDAVHVFREEEGQWRLWRDCPLDLPH